MVDESLHIPPGANSLVVSRDAEYKIIGELSGKGTKPEDEGRLFFNGHSGEIVPVYDLAGADEFGILSYKLSGVRCLSAQGTWQSNDRRVFRADLVIDKMVVERRTQAPVMWRTDWFLNGPRSNFIFDQQTNRNQIISRSRNTGQCSVSVQFEATLKSSAYDHTFVNLGDFAFLVGEVPQGMCPDWTVGLGIEYRPEWGSVPNAETRATIAEAVSFVFGRQLFPVGWTEFDGKGFPIRAAAQSAWSPDLLGVCTRPDSPPVEIRPTKSPWVGRTHEVLESLVPAFLLRRQEFRLSNALALYWEAKRVPIGLNLPAFAAALETLMKAWFTSSKTKSRGVYISKDAFETLLDDELRSAATKLEITPYGDRMLRRIQGAYNMGANERIEIFFRELELPIGKGELAALRERNIMAHGSVDPERDVQLLAATRAYETLFNRVFLKMLGYQGKYIDYSTVNWPQRPIDEPIGFNP
jgi:hypothetical protein